MENTERYFSKSLEILYIQGSYIQVGGANQLTDEVDVKAISFVLRTF